MDFDFQVIIRSWPFLMQGLWFSIQLTVVGFVGGLVLGTVFALIKQMEVPYLTPVVSAYITLMRSIPLIMVLFWFFFLMPLVFGWFTTNGRPITIGPVQTAFITFTMFEAAYYAEIIRTGLRSIDKGQYEAARALSISTFGMYRKIIIPQVLRVTGPIIVTQTIILFQDTALVYVLSLTDLLGAGSKIAQRDNRLLEIYLTVAVIYLVICSIAAELVGYLKARNDRRMGRPRSVRTRLTFMSLIRRRPAA